MGYPHALNRHDVGWETAETDANQRHSQPASQPASRGNDRATTTTTTEKKKTASRKVNPNATMETKPWDRPPWRRDLQRPGHGNSVSDLAGLPGFTPHIRPSIHPPTLGPIFWRCTQWRRRQPTNWPMPTPPPPPLPRRKKKKNQPSSGAYQHKPPIHTHPPGTAFDTEKGVA